MRSFMLAVVCSLICSTSALSRSPEALAECFTPEKMKAEGEYYQATVPDTLDLAERGRLAVQGLLNFLDSEQNYEQYQLAFFNVNPPFMAHYGMGAANQGKIAEGVVKMRHISGSQENLDKEAAMFRGVLKRINEQGLFYNDFSKGPWAKQILTYDQLPVNTCRMIIALQALEQETDCPELQSLIREMADGVVGMAKYENDYAWFTRVPPETNPDTIGVLGYWQDLFYHAGPTRALSRVYENTGDERYIKLAKQLRQFLRHDKKYWAPSAFPREIVPQEHAIFSGHHHSYSSVLMGMLELARVTNNPEDMEFVREGYQYIRLYGIARIGLFGENCTVGDMTWLATKLSLMGVGDYWDDVDCYVRNQLVEAQLTDAQCLQQAVDEMPPLSEETVWEFDQMKRHGYASENVVERNVGAFLSDASNPTKMRPQTLRWTICCSGNCPPAIYAAWDGIVQGKDGIVQVNLLLNRASEWLDVDSYLPYEGKVVLHNKAAKVANVRMPRWVDLKQVKASINGSPIGVNFLGRYAFFDGLKKDDEIEITFPVVERKETYTLLWKEEDMWPESTYLGEQWHPKAEPEQYTFHLRGNTVVDVEPRSKLPGMPLYQRDAMKADKAPLVERTRFVPSRRIDW